MTMFEGLIALTIEFPDWLKPEIFSIGKVTIRWYSLAYLLGFLFGYIYGVRVCRKTEIWQPKVKIDEAGRAVVVPNKRILEDYIFFIMLGILLGGRIGSILLYEPHKYINDPIAIFKLWEGGMAFHGGLVGVMLGVIWMARTRKVPLLRLADIVAIATPIGLGLGRIANFINQELWGEPTSAAWGVLFSPQSDPQQLPRHPTQLYEAFLEGFVIFTLLYIAVHKYRALTRPGLCAGLFLLMYGVFRILIETVRVPDPIPQFGFLTRGMAYSLPMVALGCIFIVYSFKRGPVNPVRLAPDQAKAT